VHKDAKAPDPTSRLVSRAVERGSILLGLAVLAMGIARVAQIAEPKDRFDATTLQYFLASGALLVLPRLKKLAYGDLEIDLGHVEAKADAALEAAATGVGRKNARPRGSVPPTPAPGATPAPPDDPQKHQWGGLSAAKGRRLCAAVKPVAEGADLFRVALEVCPDDPKGAPLDGPVTFHLHDTFQPMQRTVPVQQGVARLELIAWGAFTVGAEADQGRTKLELDLSAPGVDAPQIFKSR
jgi:hypothetical protein